MDLKVCGSGLKRPDGRFSYSSSPFWPSRQQREESPVDGGFFWSFPVYIYIYSWDSLGVFGGQVENGNQHIFIHYQNFAQLCSLCLSKACSIQHSNHFSVSWKLEYLNTWNWSRAIGLSHFYSAFFLNWIVYLSSKDRQISFLEHRNITHRVATLSVTFWQIYFSYSSTTLPLPLEPLCYYNKPYKRSKYKFSHHFLQIPKLDFVVLICFRSNTTTGCMIIKKRSIYSLHEQIL